MLGRGRTLKEWIVIIIGGSLISGVFVAQDKPKEAPKEVPKVVEKTIKTEDALQDQVNDGKRQLLLERYNSKLKDFRATPEMQNLEQQITKAGQDENALRIKILKDLGIKEEDYPKWRFDTENKKIIQLTDEEQKQLQQQIQRQQ